jgi:bifunctional DNA-binding transcriptional regulator/antitoxin component of YhaV-PrlF toxin-antitoxin module
MKARVEVARRGQITIPKTIREIFGIEERQKYALHALEGGFSF